MTTAAATPKTADSWLRRYATQATVALSLVVGVTGIMMFFHIAKGEVEALHEWLGIAFVVVAALHALRHRHAFMAMLGQTRMRLLFGAAAMTAAAFVVLAPAKGSNPFRQATQVVMQAPLRDVAPLLGVSPQELATRLHAADSGQSIETIARAQGADPVGVLAAALAK